MKFNELHDLLEKNSSPELLPPPMEVNKELLEILYKQFNLNEFLLSLEKDSNILKLIASSSYTHEIGFDKIVIHPYLNTNFQLRLNVWWADKYRNASFENIHTHRWDYATVLLIGEYEYKNYKISDSEGVEKYWYNYFPRHEEAFNMKLIGRRKLSIESNEILKKGNIMSLDSFTPHKITPKEGINTISFFLNQKPIKEYTDVYSDVKLTKHGTSIQSPNLSEHKLIELLHKVSQNIS